MLLRILMTPQTPIRHRTQRKRWVAFGLVGGMLGLSACEGILRVDEDGIIEFADLEASGPTAVPTIVNGVIGNYHEAVDDITRYAALLTDEMIASGTFETRLQVDRRRIQVNNSSLTGAVYAPLHQARMQADTTVDLLRTRLSDPDFAEVEAELLEGIALGNLYGGLSRLWLGELYCWSILTGMFPESSPLMPDARVQQALAVLLEAERVAAMNGLQDIRLAAILGQARAHLWLGDYSMAAALASVVPRDFVYWAEYSHNDPSQFNEMYMFTWGDVEAIRWTVGDGTAPTRGSERWEHLDEFQTLQLLQVDPPDLDAFTSSIPVVLQNLYSEPDANVLVASGIEALLIQAETAVRAGQTMMAEQWLNDLRSDYNLRATVHWNVEPPDTADALQPLTLTGNLTSDVKSVADERARELWLTGDRLTTSRRLRRDPTVAIDLFPSIKSAIGGGDDIAFPMVQFELDNNPNLTSADACPAGQAMGAWR